MVALQLQRVGEELELWRATGQQCRFWIRDDDACGITEQLQRLASVAARYRVAIGLAVIPGLLEPDLVGFLASRGSSFLPMCHGWKHANHEGPGKPAEFGCSRPHAAARADAARALAVFRRHFTCGAVFVPPFGRIAPAMIAALRELGFVALSGGQRPLERHCARLMTRLAWAPAVNIVRQGPLPRVDAHVDLIDWRAGTAVDLAVVATNVVAQLRLRRKRLLPASVPIGLLTHHRAHDERVWQLLERLLEYLKKQDVAVVDPGGMFGLARSAAPHAIAH